MMVNALIKMQGRAALIQAMERKYTKTQGRRWPWSCPQQDNLQRAPQHMTVRVRGFCRALSWPGAQDRLTGSILSVCIVALSASVCVKDNASGCVRGAQTVTTASRWCSRCYDSRVIQHRLIMITNDVGDLIILSQLVSSEETCTTCSGQVIK